MIYISHEYCNASRQIIHVKLEHVNKRFNNAESVVPSHGNIKYSSRDHNEDARHLIFVDSSGS